MVMDFLLVSLSKPILLRNVDGVVRLKGDLLELFFRAVILLHLSSSCQLDPTHGTEFIGTAGCLNGLPEREIPIVRLRARPSNEATNVNHLLDDALGIVVDHLKGRAAIDTGGLVAGFQHGLNRV